LMGKRLIIDLFVSSVKFKSKRQSKSNSLLAISSLRH